MKRISVMIMGVVLSVVLAGCGNVRVDSDTMGIHESVDASVVPVVEAEGAEVSEDNDEPEGIVKADSLESVDETVVSETVEEKDAAVVQEATSKGTTSSETVVKPETGEAMESADVPEAVEAPESTEMPEATEIPEPTATPEPIYTVEAMSKSMYAKQSVNVRKGPSTGYDKLGSLKMNQQVAVTGQASTGWYQIDFGVTTAYVSGKYLVNEPIPTATPVPVVQEPVQQVTQQTTQNDKGWEVVITDPNILRPTEKQEAVYTAEEAVKIVEDGMRAAGYYKTLDVMTPEEVARFGEDCGMSWGEGYISRIDPQEEIAGMVDFFEWYHYNMFYFKILEVEETRIRVRAHYGTHFEYTVREVYEMLDNKLQEAGLVNTNPGGLPGNPAVEHTFFRLSMHNPQQDVATVVQFMLDNGYTYYRLPEASAVHGGSDGLVEISIYYNYQ